MTAPARCQRRDGLTKRIFRSRAKARKAARKLQGSLGGSARAYECPCCGGWHITRQPDWRKR